MSDQQIPAHPGTGPAMAFCPACGVAVQADARFCPRCGRDLVASPMSAGPVTGPVSSAVAWLVAVVSLAGLVWLWLNAGEGSLLSRLIIVGALGAVWIGIVFAVVGFLVLVLGLVGVVVRPFWRR